MNKRNIILIAFALFVLHDLAMKFECHHNTLLATCCMLQRVGIIDTQSGIGAMVANHVVEQMRAKEKEAFITNDLPELRRKVELLQLNDQDLSELMNLIEGISKTPRQANNHP